MDLNTWLSSYLNSLPVQVRLNPDNGRLRAAAAAAISAGWTSLQAARIIAARDYTAKRNPPLIALLDLEQLAEHPPPSDGRKTTGTWYDQLPERSPHPNAQSLGLKPNQCRACRARAGAPDTLAVNARTCLVCPPGECSMEPVTEPTPPDWIEERRELLASLLVTPDMTEDERGEAMASLIGKQRGT